MTTEATEKKPSNRMRYGEKCLVFEDAKQRGHFREAYFLAYCGTKKNKVTRNGKEKTVTMSLVNVSYIHGGLDVVDRRNVEKV